MGRNKRIYLDIRKEAPEKPEPIFLITMMERFQFLAPVFKKKHI